jgi:hypothetical protein
VFSPRNFHVRGTEKSFSDRGCPFVRSFIYTFEHDRWNSGFFGILHVLALVKTKTAKGILDAAK